MNLLALLLLTAPDAPNVSHLERFPDAWTAQVQAERCREHIDRLEVYRHVRGWEGGHWQDAVALTQFYRDYWETLALCHEGFGLSEVWQVRQLVRLRELVGPAGYLQGWRPPELPAYLPPDAPEEVPPP